MEYRILLQAIRHKQGCDSPIKLNNNPFIIKSSKIGVETAVSEQHLHRCRITSVQHSFVIHSDLPAMDVPYSLALFPLLKNLHY